MPVIIDISRSLSPSTAAWPGDSPFDFHLSVHREQAVGINVGAFSCSTHFATHLDAPFHFTDSGDTIDRLDLMTCYGEAAVIDVRGQAIIEDFPEKLPARVLLRTDAWLSSDQFPDSIPTLSVAAVQKLANRGVSLIGVDVPSVDQLDSKDLPIHHALHRSGITILESLYLHDVAAGHYWLAAFPLRLSGGDAAPVRAVLIVNELPGDAELAT